jgi:cytochrome c553
MIDSRWIRAGCWALAPILLALGGLARASTDDPKQIAYGRHLSQECTGCHSIHGSDTGIPSIVGWPADTLAATLKFYQTGARPNPVMVSVATSLNDKQVAALAAYFASLPKPGPKK